jgi:hypothetical protein
MSIAIDLLCRNGKVSYRVTIGRKHEGMTAYEINTEDIKEAREFLVKYVKDARAKIELTVTANGEDVYRFLDAIPPGWTPPSGT